MARLLLIDDDSLVRQTLQLALARAGHAVFAAENGREGLAVLDREAVDLVITDIIMPEGEGIETILEIRRRAPAIPIIAISGGGRTGHLDFLGIAQMFGATSVLAKPFTPAVLIASVERCLAADAT